MRLLVLTLTLTTFLSSSLFAQNEKPEPPKLTGEVTSIDDSGRTKVITVTDSEGNTHELRVTPKLDLQIKSPGDEGFIREGAFIGGQGVLTNDMLFIKDLSVLVPAKGQKLPRGAVSKSARQAGQSQNSYDIRGTIQAAKPNPDYPEYTMIALDIRGRIPPINLEKNVRINVVAMNSDLVEVGMPVEMYGTESRGRFNIQKVVVDKSEPFKAEEVFASEEK